MVADVYDTADWRALVAAVRAEPADDLPRLVAADWLDDRGEADRAELIRVECELERRWSADARHGLPLGHLAQAVRERVYSALNPPGVARFARGFVEDVRCPAADWVAHADALLAREPVAKVVLTSRPEYEAYAGTPDVPAGRVRGGLVGDPGGHLFVVPASGDLARRLLEARWPGVTFALPPPPADRPGPEA